MAYQIEVIRFKDLLPVTSLPGFVQGFSPLTLIVKGENFLSADRVLLNDIDVPEFLIVDKNTIYAQMPSNDTVIQTIEVVSSQFTKNVVGSKIMFELGNKTQKVDGLLKLVQLFTKWIMQSPGSDVFDPTRGGGLQDLVGKVGTTKDLQPVFAAITQAIQVTSDQIRAAQATQSALPLSERLLSATMVDLSTFDQQMEARVRVEIDSMAGIDAVTALQL